MHEYRGLALSPLRRGSGIKNGVLPTHLLPATCLPLQAAHALAAAHPLKSSVAEDSQCEIIAAAVVRGRLP